MLYITATTRNFNITVSANQGGATTNWLQIAGAGNTTTPAPLHVSVAPAGLNPGTYIGSVHVVAVDGPTVPSM